MQNVFNEMEQVHANVLKTIKEILMKVVDQNVFSALIAPLINLVCAINAKTHVPVFAEKMLNATPLIMCPHVTVLLVILVIRSEDVT
jgi:hypothetical protein